jgi:hypothetical protein
VHNLSKFFLDILDGDGGFEKGFVAAQRDPVDAPKDFPDDPLLGVRATILRRIDWLSGLIGALLW